MSDTSRPSWEEVMKPLADSPLWLHIRQAGGKLCEKHLHEMGDFDSGIGSSDINHTIFGFASWAVPNRESHTYPSRVLAGLLDEVDGY